MKVNDSKCVGCGLCVENCPVNAIKLDNGKAKIDADICIECGLCAANCPSSAISGEE